MLVYPFQNSTFCSGVIGVSVWDLKRAKGVIEMGHQFGISIFILRQRLTFLFAFVRKWAYSQPRSSTSHTGHKQTNIGVDPVWQCLNQD